MNQFSIKKLIGLVIVAGCLSFTLHAANNMNEEVKLSTGDQNIIVIAALTAKGDLSQLKPALNTGLEAGLSINQIKEVLVHLYAYCGFPRSIRGLQTFMEVLNERKARGITDKTGADASPVNGEQSKYERGKKVLGELTKAPQDGALTGYAAFAPVIDTFLKEHLFADIFERDVLTYSQRELVTVSVLSAIGGVEPMLRSHLSICMNVGLSPEQLNEFVAVIKSTLGEKEAKDVQAVLFEVLKSRK
jgi:alkylhydroperoxidase/carboxymuconolactone decarboxylase family protein YurZ